MAKKNPAHIDNLYQQVIAYMGVGATRQAVREYMERRKFPAWCIDQMVWGPRAEVISVPEGEEPFRTGAELYAYFHEECGVPV